MPSPMSPRPSGRVAFTETPLDVNAEHVGESDRGSRRDAGRSPAARQIIVRSQRDGARPAPGTIRTSPASRSEPAIACDGRIGVGEMLADVAERGRPEQRVGERVAHRVPVGMARETAPRPRSARRRATEVAVRAPAGARRTRAPRADPQPCGAADPRLRLREVEQGGDLEVLRITGDRTHRAAGQLEQRGVVGDAEPRCLGVLRALRAADRTRNACGVCARASSSRSSVVDDHAVVARA